MEISYTSEELEFRDQVRGFLRENLNPFLVNAGMRMTSIFSDFDASLLWQEALRRKGWLAVGWPEEFGGVSWTPTQQAIFTEESRQAGAPMLLPFGVQMLGPILLKYGTEAQKQELLPRILSGEDLWCQGYSEPGSGSDLASLRMRAETVGDTYVLNGSKIWTSFAHRSNKIFCLVRTDSACKPQAGISFLLVDLDSPGISVRPIVSLDDEVEQCEVFFENVEVPRSNLVGRENQGWEIAKYLLQFERGAYCYYAAIDKQFARLAQLTRTISDATSSHAGVPTAGDAPDDVFNHRLAELEVDKLALQCLERRITSGSAINQPALCLASVVKVVGTELSQRVDELCLQAAGPYVAVKQNEVFDPSYEGSVIGPESAASVAYSYINNRAATIYGGSAQIQRNIIADYLLEV
ncbi:MAG: acyl-CoA dehydrogenase family protein [Pseudomonadota bacterium]